MPGWTGVAGVFKITLGLSALPPMSLHMWSSANKPLTHSICRSSILLSEQGLRPLSYTNVLCHARVELDERTVLLPGRSRRSVPHGCMFFWGFFWLGFFLSDRHTVGMTNYSHSVKHGNLL